MSFSGAPKLYTSKPEPPQLPSNDLMIKAEDILKMTTSINPLKKESKKLQPTILPGKEMAEAVKATSKTVVVSAGGNAVAAAECAASIPNQSAKSKGKKNKKFIRTSGGQVWEDQTLSEWDEGMHFILSIDKLNANSIIYFFKKKSLYFCYGIGLL